MEKDISNAYQLLKGRIELTEKEFNELDELEKTKWLYANEIFELMDEDYEGLVPQQHPEMYLSNSKKNYNYALKFIKESLEIYEQLKPAIDEEKVTFPLFCLLSRKQQKDFLERKEREANNNSKK